jgi:hypothetical protein
VVTRRNGSVLGVPTTGVTVTAYSMTRIRCPCGGPNANSRYTTAGELDDMITKLHRIDRLTVLANDQMKPT